MIILYIFIDHCLVLTHGLLLVQCGLPSYWVERVDPKKVGCFPCFCAKCATANGQLISFYCIFPFFLSNQGPSDFPVSRGDRIAQLVCEKISYPELREVTSLEETERGAGGFGSTGKD